jgi:hypothetical protein
VAWITTGRFSMIDIIGSVFIGASIAQRNYLVALICLLAMVFIAGLRGKP